MKSYRLTQAAEGDHRLKPASIAELASLLAADRTRIRRTAIHQRGPVHPADSRQEGRCPRQPAAMPPVGVSTAVKMFGTKRRVPLSRVLS